MRIALIPAAALLAACAGQTQSTTADASQPVDRACTVADCFNERDVRDFEVVNNTTVILYVGAQRCAFRVDLTGTFCDVTFAPQIYFRHSSEPIESDPRGLASGSRSLNDKVCANDLNISVDAGAFTESQPVSPIDPRSNPRSAVFDTGATDRFGNRRSDCRVNGVASLTDDEVVELLVERGRVAPPPPMGSGEIKVDNSKQQGGDDAPPAQAGEQPTASAD
jgi:hypothetical protein